jgi:WD40 repeat protein
MPIDLQRIQSIFQAVAELPPAERAAVLERECGGDAELRRQVEALLQAHDDSGELPAAEPQPTGAYVPAVEPGQVFAGRYKLRQKLGEGGMGVVFVADQTEPVQRRVALKIIRAGLDTHRLLARFEQERQALALMDHPNIAKVFDAGMDQARRPYFAMELVKGMPLTRYCDDAKLSPRQRLELFMPVCQAVQHAHQKGIIHRDLKPSNILVGLYDGRPVPKVIDFGVAKATGPRLTEQSVYTEVGSIIGTLEYMSPEQAELNNLDIDTRSDIYALGVILYELLTGAVPFSRKELEQAGLAEMLRVIKEREPPKPSTKLSHSGTLPSIAAQRQMEPAKLTKLVRGELDWIVMKALEKDRSRRYETANGFAADVQRYLAGEPVQAVPPSAGYRLRKFVRRNRGPVLAGAALVLALVAGIAGTTLGLFRAEERRVQAEQAREAEAEQRREADRRGDALARSNRRIRLQGYAASVQLAQREWELGNLPRVRSVLHDLRPAADADDLRGFEWHYLRRQCEDSLLTLSIAGVPPLPNPRTGRSDSSNGWIGRIEVSPDGSRVLAVSGGRVHAWALPGGRPVTLIADPQRYFLDARFSPDGKRLATLADTLAGEADRPSVLELWDPSTDARLRSTELPKGNVGYLDLAFQPGGRQVAVSVDDLRGDKPVDLSHAWVVVVDAETGRVIRKLEGKPINEALTYSPDGKWLVGPAAHGKLNVWDADSGRVVQTIDTGENIVRDAAFRPDGTRLAIAGDSGKVTVWSVPGWAPLQSLRVSDQNAQCARFSPDGKTLATLGGGSIKVWDAATGEYLFMIRGAWACLDFTPDGGRIATRGDVGTIRFRHANQEQGALVHKAKESLYQAQFSADGRRVIDDCGTVLDASTGVVIRAVPSPKGETVRGAVLLPDGKRAILTRYKSDPPPDRLTTADLILWDVEADQEIKRLAGVTFPTWIEGSPDGRWFLTLTSRADDTSYKQKELTVRDAATWEPVLTRKDPPVYGRNALFTNDSKSVVLGEKDAVTILEVPSGRVQKTYGPLPVNPLAVAVSPDGRWIAAAGSNNQAGGSTIHVWDVASGDKLHVIPQTAGEDVVTLSFSPDGRRLASAGFDARIKLWDTEIGLELLTLNGHTSWIWVARFSPDGRKILSCSRDRTVRIWDASPLPPDLADRP